MTKKLANWSYDQDARRLTLVFSNGGQVVVSNMSQERAQVFLQRHAEELAQRDARLTTPGLGVLTR